MAEVLQEGKSCYAVVRRIFSSLLTLAHRGNQAYSEYFDPVYGREASKPNANGT
jgi:putative transposase